MLPLEVRHEIGKRYEGGEHTGELAVAYKVSTETIRRVLAELNIHPDRARSGSASWARRTGVASDEGDMLTGFRTCVGCRTRKPITEFYWRAGKRTRVRRCAACYGPHVRSQTNVRANRRKAKYGLAGGEFDAMLSEQRGRCAICADVIKDEAHGVNVDHCHFDGQVRGLLCTRCNVGLGQFRDDPDLLIAAAGYLMTRGHWHPPISAEPATVSLDSDRGGELACQALNAADDDQVPSSLPLEPDQTAAEARLQDVQAHILLRSTT